MLDRTVTPHECALIVAIPRTPQEFEADKAVGAAMDFARNVVKKWDREERLVRLVEEMEDRVEKLGVRVYRTGRLCDVRDAFDRDAVLVTVMAHFVFPEFSSSDITFPQGLADRLRDIIRRSPSGSDSRVQSVLRMAVSPQVRTCLFDRHDWTDPDSVRLLVGELNRLVVPSTVFYVDFDVWVTARTVGVGASAADGLTRFCLEQEFSRELEPGRAIEFRDGLKTCREFVNTIPHSFEGVIELAICNSVILAEFVRRYRPNVNSIINTEVQQSFARMVAQYSRLIHGLSKGKMSVKSALGEVLGVERDG